MSAVRVRTIPSPSTILGIAAGDVTNAIRPYRVGRGSPCHICGKSTECIAIPDARRPGHTHAWCTRTANDAVLQAWGFKDVLYYYYLDGAGDIHIVRRPARRQIPLVDAATMDRTLRETARILGLSEAHRAKLAARGYDVSQCGPNARHAFASLPADDYTRQRAAADLEARFATEAEVLGTLGYSRDHRRRPADAPISFLSRVNGSALIEFCRDELGRFTGFEFAPDEPRLDNKGKPIKRESPVRMVKRAHVARSADDAGAEVWHCEGIHKANLTADRRHAIALGALGVGNVSLLVAGAQAVDPHARRLHVIALDAGYHGSKNETELARRLHDAGYRVALARWDAGAGNGPDDVLVTGGEITVTPFEDGRPKPRTDMRITHAYSWQRDEGRDQAKHLNAICKTISTLAEQHLLSTQGNLLIITAPPGTGKSHALAALGERSNTYTLGRYQLAWVAQRHDMAQSIPALQTYLQIEPANTHNCPDGWRVHQHIASIGYNTASVHNQHTNACGYLRQWMDQGSAFFQLAHVRTRWIVEKDGIIIDELDIASWLDKRDITTGQIVDSSHLWPADSVADKLHRAINGVLSDVARDATKPAADRALACLRGKSFFDTLDRHCQGFLAAWIGALVKDDRAVNTHPYTSAVDIYEADAMERAKDLPRVTLPYIMQALIAELPKWLSGDAWNSNIQVIPTHGSALLRITEPLRFGGKKHPPIIIADATADEELVRRLMRVPVHLVPADITPPAHMQHIAIRTNKRYGKVSMTFEQNERYRARVIAEVRYLLKELDPDGQLAATERIGLVTYQGCEREIAEALSIPQHRTGHFWAMRGSNALEDCEILIVIGTPTLNLEETRRLARALYCDDALLDETSEPDENGEERFRDPRLQHLADYLIRSELTQCCHRNRPLRHDGRTVVTFTTGAIDFLPVTTEITQLPFLTIEGDERTTKRKQQAEQRIRDAIATLQARGESITVRNVSALARVSLNTVSTWLREQGNNAMSIDRVLSELYIRSIYTTDNAQTIDHNISASVYPPLQAPRATAPDCSTDIPAPISLADVADPSPPPKPRAAIPLAERVTQLEGQGLHPDAAMRRALIERGALSA
jgi:hypothetical protein